MNFEILTLMRSEELTAKEQKLISAKIDSGEIDVEELKFEFVLFVGKDKELTLEQALNYVEEHYQSLLSFEQNYKLLKNGL